MDWSLIIENSIKGLVGINAVYFAVAAIGMNVQYGYTGLLNFGQAGFMACGAYGLGMTAHYFDISMWWGIPLGIVFSVPLSSTPSPLPTRTRDARGSSAHTSASSTRCLG